MAASITHCGYPRLLPDEGKPGRARTLCSTNQRMHDGDPHRPIFNTYGTPCWLDEPRV